MTNPKIARADYPVHELILNRWSPYGYDGRSVADEDICALFEAARWAPSCFNEQPWRYILARREQTQEFARLLSCLVDGNQAWAKSAGALVLGVISLKFSRNDKPNRHAAHDLGLASAQLTLEAIARGLLVHQMAGIRPDRARELYGIPEDHEVMTALAIGYQALPEGLEPGIAERDLASRQRKRVGEFLYESSWGVSAKVLG